MFVGTNCSNFRIQSKCPSTILFSSTPQDGLEQELRSLLAKLEVANQHDRQESEEHNLADRWPVNNKVFLQIYFIFKNISYMLTYQQQDVSANIHILNVVCGTCQEGRTQQLREVCLASLLLPSLVGWGHCAHTWFGNLLEFIHFLFLPYPNCDIRFRDLTSSLRRCSPAWQNMVMRR